LYEGAIRLSPCELGYHLGYVNFLSAVAGKTAGAERLDAVDRIAGSGETAVACHPNDAVAHFILGSGALMQAIVGRGERLGVAEEQLDAALRLDPYRLDVLDWRRQAASLRGEQDPRDFVARAHRAREVPALKREKRAGRLQSG